MHYLNRKSCGRFDPTADKAINRVARTERGIKRGDRYYVYDAGDTTGTEQRKSRPCIVVSNNKCNKASTTIEIVYLTTAIKTKSLPTHAVIMGKYESIALCEQVHSVSIERLGRYLGSCSAEEMEKVNECLAISLGLKEVE